VEGKSVATKLAVETDQTRVWMGEFGREYTDRNDHSPDELDRFYQENYGVSRRKLNEPFLSGISKQTRILEVGCNTGTQLLMLQEMGYSSLYGIEIQDYALERAKARLPRAELRQASALSIPYPEKYFDLVFTSGVLIHIGPSDLAGVLGEIHRCSKKWIWGFEYYAPQPTEIQYRGHEQLLWKRDFAKSYCDEFADLELVKEERVAYLQDRNVDSMFLLKRQMDTQDHRCV
jgi:pseudaminic acid biosynthesis-associated methylase